MTVFLSFKRRFNFNLLCSCCLLDLYFLYECQCYCGSLGYIDSNNNQETLSGRGSRYALDLAWCFAPCSLHGYSFCPRCRASAEESGLSGPARSVESKDSGSCCSHGNTASLLKIDHKYWLSQHIQKRFTLLTLNQYSKSHMVLMKTFHITRIS